MQKVEKRLSKNKKEKVELDSPAQRILARETIPLKKPKWLSARITPINDGNYVISTEYPDLLDSKFIEKRQKKRRKQLLKKAKKAKRKIKITKDMLMR